MVYINHISYYLPEKILSNDDLVKEFPDWSVKKIANKIGINKRHIAAQDELSSDMAIEASEKLFKEHNVERSKIDFLLFCTQSPDYFLPTTACILQDKLNIPTSAGALDFNLGCSGFIYGLSLAKGLIAGGIANNILLVCAETYSKFLNSNDRGNRTIFGDAASATIISNEKNGMAAEILNFSLGTDGSGAENLIVKGGGMRNRNGGENILEDDYGNEYSDNDLKMNGPAIFNFTVKRIPELVNDTLLKNNLKTDDVKHFIFHQANSYMLNHLRKKMKVSSDKFPIKMDFCGNTVSSTIQIVLSEMNDDYSFKKDDLALLAGFGVGYSWGAVAIKFH